MLETKKKKKTGRDSLFNFQIAVQHRETTSPVDSARESRYANLQFILLKQQIGSPDDNRFLIQHTYVYIRMCTRNALHSNGKQSYWCRFICLIDKYIYFIGNIENCNKCIIIL